MKKGLDKPVHILYICIYTVYAQVIFVIVLKLVIDLFVIEYKWDMQVYIPLSKRKEGYDVTIRTCE